MPSPLPGATLIVKGPAAADVDLRSAVDAVRADGVDLEVRVTYESGDATRFAAEAARLGVPRVIAAGGDGTLNEVVCGVLDTEARPCLGLVPVGTANDFARTLGAPLGDPEGALRLALDAPSVPVDIGRVNDRPFVNVSSCGIGAAIVAETPLGLKSLLGSAAYSVAALRRLLGPEPTTVQIDLPGSTWTGDAFIVAVGNARTAGGGYRVTGRALLDDGLLDVLVVDDAGVDRLASLLMRMVEFGPEGSYDGYLYTQVPRLKVTAPDGLHVNVDGEPMHGTVFSYSAVPRAIDVALGPDAPLVV